MENAKTYEVTLQHQPAKCQICTDRPASIHLTSVESFKVDGKATTVKTEEKLCLTCLEGYYPEDVSTEATKQLEDEREQRHAPAQLGAIV